MLQLNNELPTTVYAFPITGDTVFFIDLFRSTMSTCSEFIAPNLLEKALHIRLL